VGNDRHMTIYNLIAGLAMLAGRYTSVGALAGRIVVQGAAPIAEQRAALLKMGWTQAGVNWEYWL